MRCLSPLSRHVSLLKKCLCKHAQAVGKATHLAGKRLSTGFLHVSAILAITSAFPAWHTEQAITTFDPHQPATMSFDVRPSVDQLNQALSQADNFIGGLYKPLDSETSSVAEYFGFPLKVYYANTDTWTLVGEAKTRDCGKDSPRYAPTQTGAGRYVRDDMQACDYTTEVDTQAITATTETFTVNFRTPMADRSPLLEVAINWQTNSGLLSATITNVAFVDSTVTAHLYLGDLSLGIMSKQTVGERVSVALDKSQLAVLQSHRYTIRSGNQATAAYYAAKRDTRKTIALQRLETQYGFVPGYDIHAILWGAGTDLPDTAVDNADAMYHDCSVKMPTTARGYVYGSKVCTYTPNLYMTVGRSDVLLRTIQAIQLLNKYHAPDGNAVTQSQGIPSPVEVAQTLVNDFNAMQQTGIPMRTPLGRGSEASGVRTAGAAILWTLLAYQYNLPGFQPYADAAMSLLLRTQIGEDGAIHTTRGTFYRPTQAGGFIGGWTTNLEFNAEKPIYYKLVDIANMPPEYAGLIATNMEATLDATAALTTYQCAVYSVGCQTPAPVLSSLNVLMKVSSVTKTPSSGKALSDLFPFSMTTYPQPEIFVAKYADAPRNETTRLQETTYRLP